ncbi:hypothetical protein GQ457_11G006730 [Hibiscus cannabinus]
MAVETAVADGGDAPQSNMKNRIQVSNTKKALRYMQQYNEVQLSGLGMAITTVVTVAEILKNSGLAIEKKVSTATVGMKDENKGSVARKTKIEIILGKSDKFDTLTNANNVSQETAAPRTEE